MVKDAAKRRDIIAIGTRIAQMGHANDADTDSIIGNALDEAFHIGEDDSSTDYKDIYTVSTDMLDHLDKIQKGEIAEGVHTGFRDIDDVTHGLQPGQMIVVADARPWESPRWEWTSHGMRPFTTTNAQSSSAWK